MVALPQRRVPGKIDPLATALDVYLAEVLADSPIGYWPLAAGSGVDVVGGRDATMTGSPTSQAGPTGVAGQASGFDGTSQYGRTSTSTVFTPNGDITFEVWAKTSNPVDEGFLLGAIAPSGSQYSWFINWYLDKIEASIGRSGSGYGYLYATTPSALAVDQWHHFAATLTGTTLRLYTNGTQVGSTSTTTGTRATGSAHHVSIANFNASYMGAAHLAKATIARAAFYGSALSATRIAAHYSAGS